MVAPSVLTLGTVPNARALRQAYMQAAMEGAVGMPEVTTQYLPSYTVGTEAYGAVRQVVGSAEAVVIGGHKAMAAGLDRLKAAVEGSDVHIVDALWYGGEATYTQIERLEAEPSVQAADAIFAMGGGKVVDTCKMVAHNLGKPLYTFPTIASNCSPVSCISILYNDDGSFREIVQLHVPPAHCFIDTRVIAEAPEVYLWAGIGDTIAKYYEVTFSMRGDSPAYAPVLGQAISCMCAEPLLSHATAALADCRENRVSADLEHAALNIVVSTGLVSGLVGVDYNSALAHALFYGLTTIPSVEHDHLHGEVVSYGVLVQLAMDGEDEELQKLLHLYRSLGLPTCLADLGLTLEGDFTEVLAATEVNQELRHVPYTVTQELIWNAIVKLEEVSAACDVPAAPAPTVPLDGNAA